MEDALHFSKYQAEVGHHESKERNHLFCTLLARRLKNLRREEEGGGKHTWLRLLPFRSQSTLEEPWRAMYFMGKWEKEATKMTGERSNEDDRSNPDRENVKLTAHLSLFSNMPWKTKWVDRTRTRPSDMMTSCIMIFSSQLKYTRFVVSWAIMTTREAWTPSPHGKVIFTSRWLSHIKQSAKWEE